MVMVVTDRIGAIYVLSSFKRENVRNSGVSRSEEGSICVTRKIMISTWLPGSLNRETPYAAGTARRNDIVVAQIAMMNELRAGDQHGVFPGELFDVTVQENLVRVHRQRPLEYLLVAFQRARSDPVERRRGR